MSEKKISEIKAEFDSADINELDNLIKEYEDDTRSGVCAAIQKAKKRIEKLEVEKERIEKLKFFENKYYDMGYKYIAGIDEVGRGPLAGPVVTCAVILPKDCDILYINDSKKISAKKREELYDEITEKALAIGIGIRDHRRIDEINILQATFEAMRDSIKNLKIKPDILLNDAVDIPEVDIKQVPIIKGDAKSISIGAASIIAKVTRDRMMEELDSYYPGYGFASNKGYGSAEHIEAIKRLGPTPIHRRTFIKNFCD
ncbi:MAG: ribonuclease HII [Lachnospiraceae bacterium]|nr:ribonuclease HII [Lachnospiraceae bacterium]